ncbi:MAG TPA: hypothetical protein VIK91_18945, partial [Nannocystis sp.]
MRRWAYPVASVNPCSRDEVLLALLAALLVPPRPQPGDLRSGDILLQTSRSSHALAVAAATTSRRTHVG